MDHALRPAHQFSTNVRFMLEVAARRLAMRASAAIAPTLAGLWAERRFLTPPRLNPHASTLFEFTDAHADFACSKGRHIATWRWGSPERPAVLLVHGWGGCAPQMRAFVGRLLAAGYRVVAYDHPAHGRSEGTVTGLPDLADALADVVAHHGGIEAAIAHSLGGAAVALALARGVQARRAVLISPPADLIAYSRRFARWLAMPEAVRHAMQCSIEERYGVRWAELDLSRIAPRVGAEALVIHDRGDRVIAHRQGEAVAHAWPRARLLTTTGLGHGRILQDEAVGRAAVDFIAGRSGIAWGSASGPPAPAPLY